MWLNAETSFLRKNSAEAKMASVRTNLKQVVQEMGGCPSWMLEKHNPGTVGIAGAAITTQSSLAAPAPTASKPVL